MGKALLILVLGSGLLLGRQLLSSHESENRSARDQRNFQENILAREIATSAFNVGMGEIRAYGERVRDGVVAFNGTNNAGRTATIASGRYAGGKYTVRADMTSGHSVRVTSDGYYGRYVDRNGREQWRGHVRMHDEYRVQVLEAREKSIINVSFIPGAAGHCSAVFFQAFTPDTPVGQRPPAQMLFVPKNGNRSGQHPSREIIVEAGTQMNFFIGVDQNCSEEPPDNTPACTNRATAMNYALNYAHYRTDGTNAGSGKFDYLHYALSVEAGSLDDAQEDIWAMVEQHPASRTRWRIGWEDIHNTSWNQPTSSAPAASLQATKRLGYDGLGWPTSDAMGYSQMRDYGSRPDFEDQMIEVTAIPAGSEDGIERIENAIESYEACSLPVPQELIDALPAPVIDQDGASCTCQGSKNVYQFHRPPGNPTNVSRVCLKESQLNSHRTHDDYVICRGIR